MLEPSREFFNKLLDPADGTLWLPTYNSQLAEPWVLWQFSKTGTFISTVTYSSMQQFSVQGAEFAITSSTSAANLQVTALSAPGSALAGSSIDVSDTTSNAGGSSANSSVTDFWLSADRNLDNGDTQLGSRSIGLLAAGASSQGTTTLAIPQVPGGTYYIIANADGTNAVAESNEADNTRVKRISIDVPIPDLRIGALTLNPATPTADSPFTVTVTTTNSGTGTSVASFTRLYRSSNGSVGDGDVLLAEFAIGALAPGANSNNQHEVTLPAGTYYLIAVSDATGTNTESSERNNTSSVRVRIR